MFSNTPVILQPVIAIEMLLKWLPMGLFQVPIHNWNEYTFERLIPIISLPDVSSVFKVREILL